MVQKKAARRTPRSARPLDSRTRRTPVSDISPEEQIVGAVFLGKVKDYLSKMRVMILPLEAPLALGDMIRVKGHTTDLTQRVEHLEVERSGVTGAAPGDVVGIQSADKVRSGDAVYKI